MEDMGLQTVDDLARVVGAKRSAASNWINAYHLPPVKYMKALKRHTNITLDWIYDGDSSGLTYAASIRLNAILSGLKPENPVPDPTEDPPPASEARLLVKATANTVVAPVRSTDPKLKVSQEASKAVPVSKAKPARASSRARNP